MSRFITLAWGKAGIAQAEATRATGAFISQARAWMRHHGHSMPWQWVQECGEALGQHAHILLHVPAELDQLFRPMPLRWVKAVLAGQYTAGILDCQRMRAAYTAHINPGLYDAILRGKVNYMLKCAPPELELQLGLKGFGHKPWGQRTLVFGKRAAVWQLSGRGERDP